MQDETKTTEENLLENVGNDTTTDFEADQNLIDFFSLLLQVDKRINPDNYRVQKQDD